jgi:hypothetical protein
VRGCEGAKSAGVQLYKHSLSRHTIEQSSVPGESSTNRTTPKDMERLPCPLTQTSHDESMDTLNRVTRELEVLMGINGVTGP